MQGGVIKLNDNRMRLPLSHWWTMLGFSVIDAQDPCIKRRGLRKDEIKLWLGWWGHERVLPKGQSALDKDVPKWKFAEVYGWRSFGRLTFLLIKNFIW